MAERQFRIRLPTATVYVCAYDLLKRLHQRLWGRGKKKPLKGEGLLKLGHGYIGIRYVLEILYMFDIFHKKAFLNQYYVVSSTEGK